MSFLHQTPSSDKTNASAIAAEKKMASDMDIEAKPAYPGVDDTCEGEVQEDLGETRELRWVLHVLRAGESEHLGN